MKILIVEDDKNTRNGLVDLLFIENHLAVGVDDASSALKLLESNTFDLILCDFRLPDAHKLTLCANIHQKIADITLFMFTAYGNLRPRELAISCGISLLFSKPLDIDELFHALEAIPADNSDPSRLN